MRSLATGTELLRNLSKDGYYKLVKNNNTTRNHVTKNNFHISLEWLVDGAISSSSSNFLLHEFSAARNP